MPDLTKEQYAEILSTFERASWYLKCASEKLEMLMPSQPTPPPKPTLCAGCRDPIDKNQIYCAKCAQERGLNATV